MSDKYLNKIAALLRQAESTTNEHEAATYMAAAQKLATATSIDLAVARAHQANKEKRETPIQKRISIGDRGKKGLKYYCQLFLGIGGENDVTFNIAHNSTYVIAFGFPSDIEMTETLYSSLIVQMIEASDRFIRSGEYKAETERRWVDGKFKNGGYTPGHYADKPVDGRIARANFQEAFVNRITQRLREARQSAIAEAKSHETLEISAGESSGTDIVLANKAVEVHDFYKAKSTARGSWGGYNGSSSYSSVARSAGRAAGSSARLGGSKALSG